MKAIITDNLCLRLFRIEDIREPYLLALQDEEVVRHTEVRHRRWIKESVKEFVRQSNRPGESLLIGLFLKSTGQHIGNIRLFNFSEIHRRLELSIMIYNKNEWGKGYGAEAIKGIENYVFKELKYHKICADYHAPNVGSARMFEKCGYQIEGIFKEHFWVEGHFVASVRIAKYSSNTISSNENL